VSGTTKVFGWRAMLNRLLSKVNLQRRRITVSCNLCPFCRMEEETVQHIFSTCVVAHRLWVKCYNWVGIKSVRNYDIANQFCNFYVNAMSKRSNFVWKGMWMTLALEIWKHRNRIVFDKGKLDEIKIFAMTQL